METKKDLTAPKNLINYVIYTFAAVISFLYVKSESKGNDAIKACYEEHIEDKERINKLLDKAYNLEIEGKIKDTMLQKSAEVFDSISAQTLKSRSKPFLQKIKKYSK